MSKTKFLKGECTQCGGHLEFPAEAAGQTTTCPHCGQTTELFLYTPPLPPTIPRRTLIWTGIAVVVLLLGLVGGLYALNKARAKMSVLQQRNGTASGTNTPEATSASNGTAAPQPENKVSLNGFRAGEIRLDKAGNLIYAIGSLTNSTARQRFGVRVTLDLFDTAGKKLGTATDYQAGMEGRAVWDFKALVVDKNAVKAQIASVTEQQ